MYLLRIQPIFLQVIRRSLRAVIALRAPIRMRLPAIAVDKRLFNTSAGEAIYQVKRMTATYLHCYFPSNPVAAARLFLP